MYMIQCHKRLCKPSLDLWAVISEVWMLLCCLHGAFYHVAPWSSSPMGENAEGQWLLPLLEVSQQDLNSGLLTASATIFPSAQLPPQRHTALHNTHLPNLPQG